MNMHRCIITNAHFAGNKGSSAMVKSLCDALFAHYQQALEITFLSVYYQADCAQNPYSFLTVVDAPPLKVLFLAFPLAVLYKLFHRIDAFKAMLLHNRVLKAFTVTDVSVDLAGISYSDSRSAVMNIYGFVLNAIPMLLGVPVVKYSQALGPFHGFINRTLSKYMLPKIRIICSRGGETTQNLLEIGVKVNVSECADGAFAFQENKDISDLVDASVKRLAAFRRPVIALSLSTVVEKKCVKQNIAYIDIMKAFTQYLLEKGYGIWMLANAAQASADTRRNNDLVLCRELYARFKDDPYVAFIDKEMEPEEIRSYLGHCRSLVGSRFHAMVFAYTKKIPVMLVGWSHKYREVGASLGVDSFTLDYKTLALSEMKQTFDAFDVAHDELRASLAEHLPGVIASAQKNVQIVIGVMEEVQL